MALFKFRLPGQGEASDGRRRAGASTNARNAATPAESVESLRQRARHRVIGATVLVVVAVIGFPMLFDTEPRPVGPDVAFHIPDRDKAPPMGEAEPARPDERVQAQDSLAEHEEVMAGDATEAPGGPRVASISGADRAAQAERDKAERERAAKDKAEQDARERAARERADKAAQDKAAQERAARDKAAKEKAAQDRAAKEKAARDKAERDKRLAQEKAAREKTEREKAERLAKEKAEKAEKTEQASKDKAGRFVVQVGSFAEDARAREARSKLERAGISTYLQVIETKDGKRTRVRVGPFGSRAEAEAAAQKVKALGLYSGIAEL